MCLNDTEINEKTDWASPGDAQSVRCTGSAQNYLAAREADYDHIKALLIYLMVPGHLLTRFGATPAADTLYLLIFTFHMPAFIFVSGYFARCNAKKTLKKLAPLYVVFQCVQYLMDAVVAAVQGGDWMGALYAFQLFTPRWTLWYLLALMVYQLFLPLLDTDDPRKMARNLLLAAALGLLVGCNPDTDNLLALSRIFHFLPLFLLGYYEHRCRLIRRTIDRYGAACRAAALALAAALIAATCLLPWRASWFYGTESYGTGGFQWYIRLLAWAVALGWIFILLVWAPRRPIAPLEKVGRNTLPVYLLHTIVLVVLTEGGASVLLRGNLALLALVALAITWALSRDCFAKALGKIRLPAARRLGVGTEKTNQ